MPSHTYRLTELVGSSPDGVEAAVESALVRANESLRNIRWLEVQNIRGHIEDGKVAHWQVTVKVGFTVED